MTYNNSKIFIINNDNCIKNIYIKENILYIEDRKIIIKTIDDIMIELNNYLKEMSEINSLYIDI